MPINWTGTIGVELGNGFWIFLAVVVGAFVLYHMFLKEEGKRAAIDADKYVNYVRRGGSRVL